MKPRSPKMMHVEANFVASYFANRWKLREKKLILETRLLWIQYMYPDRLTKSKRYPKAPPPNRLE